MKKTLQASYASSKVKNKSDAFRVNRISDVFDKRHISQQKWPIKQTSHE